MSAHPWANETREALADIVHRASNDAWAYRHPVKHHEPLPFVTEAQKATIIERDDAFWKQERKIENSIRNWLGLA